MVEIKNFDFHCEFGNFCIETVPQSHRGRNNQLDKHCLVELNKYLNETHTSYYTVAFFFLKEDGYSFQFVESHFIEDIKPEEMAEIWTQLIAVQKMFDAFVQASNNKKNGNKMVV